MKLTRGELLVVALAALGLASLLVMKGCGIAHAQTVTERLPVAAEGASSTWGPVAALGGVLMGLRRLEKWWDDSKQRKRGGGEERETNARERSREYIENTASTATKLLEHAQRHDELETRVGESLRDMVELQRKSLDKLDEQRRETREGMQRLENAINNLHKER